MVKATSATNTRDLGARPERPVTGASGYETRAPALGSSTRAQEMGLAMAFELEMRRDIEQLKRGIAALGGVPMLSQAKMGPLRIVDAKKPC